MTRPLTAIGEVNGRTAANVSTPPLNTTAPVAASHACSLLVPAAPAVHTMASLPRASVVVMIGEPWPPLLAHHAIAMRVPLSLTVARSPLPVGQPTAVALRFPCIVTNVPAGVVTAADALTIWPFITRSTAFCAPMPPRLLRSSANTLPSLPNASTSCDGVNAGASTTSEPLPPRSRSEESSDGQFVGAKKSRVWPENTGPDCRRITASPRDHVVAPNVLPVVTKMFVPSLDGPPVAQIPPPRVAPVLNVLM